LIVSRHADDFGAAAHPAPRRRDEQAPRRLRIAVAASGLGHVARGIEGWAQDVAAALHARGEDVALFRGSGPATLPYERVVRCLRRDNALARRFESGLMQRLVWRLGIGTAYGAEQATFSLNLLARLRWGGFDVLHVQDPSVALIVQRAWKLGLIRTRVVLGHGTNEPTDFQRRIVFLQHLAPWHLEQAGAQGMWRPTWTAIPNFVDTAVFRPGRSDRLRAELGIPADAVVVLTVAAVKRTHKRVHHLLGEFATARERLPDAPLWLVVAGGSDAETDELVASATAQLGNHVRFLVNHPRDRMPDLYRAADLFAFCSLREMMPMALVEATASGLPCVVHDHPVMRWISGPGGRVGDLARPGALAAAIEDFAVGNAAERRRQGEAARQYCVDHFSARRVIEQVLEYYEFVVQSQRRPDLFQLRALRFDGDAPKDCEAVNA
jgi:glycosyltransferase involved in cell wall biosynthesis